MRRANILIIDGDMAFRGVLREMLAALGHTVISEAESGVQGLSLARSMRPDLVLSRLDASPVSGLEVARALANEQLAPTVLIAADISSDPGDIEASGAMGFLTLPLQKADLGAMIQISTARWRRLVELDTEIRSLNGQIEARKLVGRAKAILMERHNLPEREAFRRIQSQSTVLGRPVHEIARAIITASEVSI